MFVAACRVDLHLAGTTSLKEKRQVVRSLLDRLRARGALGVAEVGAQDLWQRAVLGVVCVAETEGRARELLFAALRQVEADTRVALAGKQVEVFAIHPETG